jgi:hypothetical protein
VLFQVQVISQALAKQVHPSHFYRVGVSSYKPSAVKVFLYPIVNLQFIQHGIVYNNCKVYIPKYYFLGEVSSSSRICLNSAISLRCLSIIPCALSLIFWLLAFFNVSSDMTIAP